MLLIDCELFPGDIVIVSTHDDITLHHLFTAGMSMYLTSLVYCRNEHVFVMRCPFTIVHYMYTP